MPHPSSRFRLRLFRDIVRTFVFPSVTLSVILRLSNVCLPGYLTVPCYLAFVIFWSCTRTVYSDYIQSREARRLGARPIPRVVGKWPGNIDILLRMLSDRKAGYMQDVFLDLFHEYKSTTLNLRILWTDKIVTMDQEHIKFVFATGFNHFWRGNSQKERLENFLGNGIFNRDDEVWKTHRALARPFFARDRISDFEIFEKNTQRVLNILSNQVEDRPCDAQDLYARFTLDAASEFLFGKNLDTLTYGREDVNSFGKAFSDIQQVVLSRSTMGSIWPVFEMFTDKTAPYANIIRGWVDPIMQQVLDHKKIAKRTGTESNLDQATFLEYLADSSDDMAFIRDQLLNILLASRDTTSCLLTFATYFMAMHPHVTKKLRAEVLEHLGTDGIPTFENIRQLHYMRAVLMECLRIFHPVPQNMRESRPYPTVLPRSDPTFSSSPLDAPMYMPPSTPIVVLPFLLQRNPVLWGDDAEAFDPDRWIDQERLKTFSDNPMMFVPFSAGPRICLGQNYSLHEASFFLIRLIQQYDTFTLVENEQLTPPWNSLPEDQIPRQDYRGSSRKEVEKIWPSYALTLFVKGGLWIRYGKACND